MIPGGTSRSSAVQTQSIVTLAFRVNFSQQDLNCNCDYTNFTMKRRHIRWEAQDLLHINFFSGTSGKCPLGSVPCKAASSMNFTPKYLQLEPFRPFQDSCLVGRIDECNQRIA